MDDVLTWVHETLWSLMFLRQWVCGTGSGEVEGEQTLLEMLGIPIVLRKAGSADLEFRIH